MKVKDLIANKDYTIINFRLTHPNYPHGIFWGICKSENGKLISLDGDSYDDEKEVVSYSEYIGNGTYTKGKPCLEILVKGEWM